jgi:DNA repair protein RadA/Sms
MAKSSTQYVCQECGTIHAKWSGKCDGCGAWNTLIEESTATLPKAVSAGGKGRALKTVSLSDAATPAARTPSGIGELDRVLGGGLVAGSAILIGGDPGIGKSTLLLRMAAQLADSDQQCLYITGEESEAQVQLRAQRMGLHQSRVGLAAANSVKDILATIDSAQAPHMVIIDSIQTMYVESIDSAPGTVAQVRAASHELIRAAKKRGFALFLVGHVTKDGQIAGPRVLEHMVDTVLYFEGDRGHDYRILRGVKNRFGATDEIGVFTMQQEGLVEVSNPSALFLSQRDTPVSGAAIFAGMEGTRPLLVEIQALVSPSNMSTPRRATVGFDANRLAMILAVLEARAGLSFADKEIYLSVAGGLKITEPAADLAAALALISALTHVAIPEGLISFGEIGLTGEVRGVARANLRMKESKKLGFTRAVVPSANAAEKALGSEPISHVEELVSVLREGAC